MTPTQAQIEAAAKAIRIVQQQDRVAKGAEALAQAALAAAAEVGDDKSLRKAYSAVVAQCADLVEEQRRAAEIAINKRNHLDANTIERCAQVTDEMAREIEAWSHQDTASRLAAEMLRKAAVHLRAFKDKP